MKNKKITANIPEEMYRLNQDEFVQYLIDTFVEEDEVTDEIDEFINNEIYKFIINNGYVELKEIHNTEYSEYVDNLLNSFDTWTYEVEISFNENWSTEQTNAFLKDKLNHCEIINVKNNTATLNWNVDPTDEGTSEIDNLLHYVLKNGELGKYNYKPIS